MIYSLLSETWPIAKKRHRCIWCGEPILTGDKYLREKSVFDGHMQNHAWHPECDEDSKDYFRHENEFSAYSAERPKVTTTPQEVEP